MIFAPYFCTKSSFFVIVKLTNVKGRYQKILLNIAVTLPIKKRKNLDILTYISRRTS